MTYNDIYFRNNLLHNIPLTLDGRKLPNAATATLMLLRVAYKSRVKEFEACMEEVLQGLKPEGFDTRAQSYAEAGRAGEETSADRDAYLAERKELEDAYTEARRKKGAETVEMKGAALFTRAEYADLCGLIGCEGSIPFTNVYTGDKETLPKEALLGMIAENLVEQS